VARLERSGERWWLGLAHWIVGINHVILGAFDAALEAEARALAIGESLGDPRLQSYATWSTGWVHALRGDAEAALEACRAALGRAPDPVNTAVAQGHLGYVHLERGDRAAVPLLEAAVGEMRRFGFRRLEGRVATFLGEAYLLDGRLEKARDLVRHGLEVTAETGYRYGLGWAQHALGRIAHAAGAPAEAAAHLGDALRTFLGAQARFMTGRTHLTLAELSAARGDRAAAATRLREAHAVFRALAVPRYVERAARLAATLGLALAEAPPLSYVAVVRPGEDAVFATLEARRADLKVAEVVWDRRVGEQRRQARPVAVERRRGPRRVPPPGPSGTAAFFLSP
jgi:tetratricopeptide (TPR) repeat protein